MSDEFGDFDSAEPYERHLAHQAAKGRMERPSVEEILSSDCERCGEPLDDGACPRCAWTIDLRKYQVPA